MLILCLFKFMNMNNLQSGLFFSLTGITAVASLSSCASQKKTEEQKPYNIVYIMTDDHTAQMMSCYDKRYMETPNLDRIANDGVRFTNSFVANSLSGPSRACMITGKHSCANKFYDNTTCIFDGSQQTFPKLLQQAGYQTALIGKWHLESLPTGFNYWEIVPGQGDYYNPDFITQDNDTIQKHGKLEKKGIQTNIGNLNRDIKAANSLMQSIRQMVRSLKGWLSGLKEKKAALLEVLEQAKEPTIPELLSRYLDMRSEERTGWTSKGKLKGTVGDFNKVMEALDFLRQKEISTVESLDAYLDKVSGEILSAKTDIRKSERRIKAIDTTLSHIANHGAYKEVYKKYASIGWKTRKEKFAAEHREELDAYLAAKRFFKAHQEELPFDAKELKKERAQLSEELSKKNEGLQAVQADMKLLRDVRYWINHVLPPDQRRVVPEPGKKPSINEQLSWKIEGAKQREEQKRQQPRRQQKQDMLLFLPLLWAELRNSSILYVRSKKRNY